MQLLLQSRGLIFPSLQQTEQTPQNILFLGIVTTILVVPNGVTSVLFQVMKVFEVGAKL